MHTFKLIARFYSGIFLADFLVTLSCIYLFRHAGVQSHKIIGVLFWYKIITIVLVFYTTIYYRKNELYYYQNLGVSKLQLGIATSVFDFFLWLALILLQLLIGIPGYVFNLLLFSILIIYLYIYNYK
jgi:hypothetical protein